MRQRLWKTAGKLLCAGMFWVGAATPAHAQSGVSQQSITDELKVLAAKAGTIFVGQITSIERRQSVVEVQFRVEQPVAGASAAMYTLREWAGLWPTGHNRYVPGQRVLAFLRAGSGAGCSSPVHGAEGLLPVVVQGIDAPRLLDVRRVAASVVRAPGTPLPTEADGAIELASALAVIRPQGLLAATLPRRVALPVRGHDPMGVPREIFLHRAGSGVTAASAPAAGRGVR